MFVTPYRPAHRGIFATKALMMLQAYARLLLGLTPQDQGS
jgi:hypothetical protein